MGKSNVEQIKFAQSFLGKGGATFRKYCGLGNGTAYCDAFVTYIFHKSGNASLFCGGKKQTYCPTTIRILNKELAQVPPYLAMASDIILFDWDKNGNPNHIGFVRAKKSTTEIYTTEGNTNGGIVANKTRPMKYVQAIFRPHFKPTNLKTNVRLVVDGDWGYNSIAGLQKLVGAGVDGIFGLNTVKKTQSYFGAKPIDGAWGAGTSKAIQTKLAKAGYYTGKIDGDFGKQSIVGLQKFINAKLYTAKPQTTTQKPATPVKAEPKKTETKVVTKEPVKKEEPKKAPVVKSKRIDVDLTNQICTVYNVYSDGTSKPVMSEFVSTARKGKTTPAGNFKIQGASGGRKAKYRTASMSSGKAYAEYLCRFHGAKCMHTVPYKKRNTKGYVNKTEFNKLGKPASAGCVRMPYKLAKYIYTNCPVGTPVKVFKGKKGTYPMGKPKKYVATSNIDPTK